MGEKPSMSFTDYMKKFQDDHILVIGSIARRVLQEERKGHTINSLPDLILVVLDAGRVFTTIEKSWITEGTLSHIWRDYCTACSHPV